MITTITLQLRKLIKSRSTIKSSINAIRYYTNKINSTTQSIRQLQIRLTSLSQYITDLTNVQQGIVELDQGHEEKEERQAFEDSNFTLLVNIEDIVSKDSATNHQISSHLSNTSSGDSLKLPMIQLSKFTVNFEY